MQRQVKTLRLADRVEFRGWVAPEDIFNLINKATVVLMPSRFEGLPSVALQAAIMARPIIATRTGGLSEVVADGETGLLAAPEDCFELSRAVAYLLEHPNMAVKMGEAGRRRVRELFSWEDCVSEYERLCKRLTRQKAISLQRF